MHTWVVRPNPAPSQQGVGGRRTVRKLLAACATTTHASGSRGQRPRPRVHDASLSGPLPHIAEVVSVHRLRGVTANEQAWTGVVSMCVRSRDA